MANTSIRRKGNSLMEYFPKVASTAIAYGAILAFDGSGAVTNAASSTAKIVGFSRRKVTSAAVDADYALNSLIGVDVPKEDAVYELDVTTGTLTAAMVGLSYDLTDSGGVSVSANTYKVVTCVGYISGTKGLFKINGAYQYAHPAN
jgi:hypothetical protein